MQKAGADGALKAPTAPPDALSPDHLVAPHGGRAVELFAGVGGFRLGLERTGWRVVLGNQWEPSTRVQHAFDCYARHFAGSGGEDVNEDIAVLLDEIESGERTLPEYDLLVGGFPCQDYSVAKLLNQAHGIQGKKGVLWWHIHRLIEMSRPPMVFLENVDRLLKSPAIQRGRDFAIMLASLSDLGYLVEWRVINAADYGFPQRRRRVFIVAHRAGALDGRQWSRSALSERRACTRILGGAAAGRRALRPHREPDFSTSSGDLVALTRTFDLGGQPLAVPERRRDDRAGRVDAAVWSPTSRGHGSYWATSLVDESEVPPEYFIPEAQLDAWRYLKGAKREDACATRRRACRTATTRVRCPSRTRSTGRRTHGAHRRRRHLAVALQARRRDAQRPVSSPHSSGTGATQRLPGRLD